MIVFIRPQQNGTSQDCDGRFNKMFDSTLDMIIDGIEMLSKFTKVEIPYISRKS